MYRLSSSTTNTSSALLRDTIKRTPVLRGCCGVGCIHRKVRLANIQGLESEASSYRVRFRTLSVFFNPLTPNDPYRGRTAPLTSKRCILYIYSTNIGTEYFKHGIYCPFFISSKCSLFHNANVFGSLIFTFYIQDVLKFKKKNNSGAERLKARSGPLHVHLCRTLKFPRSKTNLPYKDQ